MKKFKKLMSALLACAMLLAIAIPVASVAAEGDKVAITVETVEAEAGANKVSVKVFAGIEPHWGGVDFVFRFDPEKLTFKSFALNPALKEQPDLGVTNAYAPNLEHKTEGIIYISWATTCTFGGYEGYYPTHENEDGDIVTYDYFGTFVFSVADGVTGLQEITAEITKFSGMVEGVQQDIPYEITNGGIKTPGGEEPPVDPCDHEWGEWEVTTPATCVAKGEKTRTCSKCQETETEEIDIDPDAHDWGEWEDCPDEEGYEQRVCKNDPEHIEKREKEGGEEPPEPFDGVVFTVETVESEAGAKNVQVNVFAPTEPHWSGVDFEFRFDPEKLTFKSFALNPAIKEQPDLGVTNAYAPNIEHKTEGIIYISWATTCTFGGYEGYYPTHENEDGDIVTYDYFGTFKFDVAEGIEDGLYEISANVTKLSGMDGENQIDVPVKTVNGGIKIGADECEHEWEETSRTDATCTEKGSITYTCSKCGETKTEDIDPLDHDWSEWEVTTPATCSAPGEETRSCSRGDATETREIPIDENAHDWIEIGRTNATCTEKGVINYACSINPDHTKDEEIDIDPDAHDWGEWTDSPDKEGYEQRVCKNDPSHVEEREKSVEPPVHEHTFGEPTYTWAEDNSTCTATRTCTADDCDETETETVTATSETTPATTEAEGKTVYTATFTNSAFETQTKEVTIPKLTPSDPEEPEKTEPEVTGVEDGKTYDVGKGEKPAPTWEPADAEGTLNGKPYTPGTEITEPGEYELVVKNGDKTTTIKFTVTDSTASGNNDQPNTSDIAVAGIAIVALIASAAVVVIARKKRFAR